MNVKTKTTLMIALFFCSMLAGCAGDDDKPSLVQTGSSTVLPLAVVWAEDYQDADVSVSGGGSSHGLNALLNGETDLADASRIMKNKDYGKFDDCDDTAVDESTGSTSTPCNGVLPVKWVLAFDVLATIVHPDNDWATSMNFTQLYSIFTDDNPAAYWDEVPGMESSAPHELIEIYAPDEASGTFDFFFESVIEDWGKDSQVAGTRLESGDGVYHPSADDNVIMTAIKNNPYAIGYLGFAYVKENPGSVGLVSLDGGSGPVEPSLSTVADYPMARPLHVYTDAYADNRDVVEGYIAFCLSDEGQSVVDEVGYVRVEMVDPDLLSEQLSRIN